MTWFFIAIIAPFLWSIVNHVDKYLLSKHSTESSVGSLMIFSTFAGVIVIIISPFLGIPLGVPVFQGLVLILAGILAALGIMLYLYALETDETSVVVPFFQLIPVFAYFFGYLFLGETMTHNQIIASLIIVCGAAILAFEFNEENKLKLRKKVVILMTSMTVIYALYETLFKVVAVNAGFVSSTFWEHIGLLIFGVTLYFGSKRFRIDFHRIIESKGKKIEIFGINIGSEILTLIGNVLTNYALLLAPVALVLVVSGYQPVFAFLIGVILTIFLPHIAEEKITLKHLVHKIGALVIILIGSYMLFN